MRRGRGRDMGGWRCRLASDSEWRRLRPSFLFSAVVSDVSIREGLRGDIFFLPLTSIGVRSGVRYAA